MQAIGKRILTLGTAVCVAGTLLMGCGKLNSDDVIATVGDSKITANVANFYARYQEAQMEATYGSLLGEDMWKQEAEEGSTYEETVKKNILESLEQYYILEDHMKDYEIVISDEEKETIKKVAQKFEEGNELEAKDAVSGDAKTVERVLTLLTVQQKMYTAMTADVSTEVSDEEAAQKSMQYVAFSFTSTDEEGKSVEADDAAKAELKQKADAFLAGAQSAEDFAAYATEAGYEAQTATFDKESTSPDAAVISAADALAEGALTEVIQTDNGYYVAKVTSLLDRDATDKKKETIVNQNKQEQFTTIYDGWKKDTKISVDKKNWAKISFAKQGITIKQDESEPYTDGEDSTAK